MYQAATKYILGIIPTHEGLQVSPCIPKGWDGFEVTRKFRGATYQIVVKNPSHVSKGIESMRVDGQEVFSALVPVFTDGGVHTVEVTMGDSSALSDTADGALDEDAGKRKV